MTKKKRSPFGIIVKVGLALVLVSATLYFLNRGGSGSIESQTFTLRRGTLPITVTANGNVKSLAPHHITAQIRERDVKILSIVEEGRRITKEDIENKLVLVELDSSGMEDNIMRDELDYESAVAEYSRAQQDLEILSKENESEIQSAERSVKFKTMDFQKYIGETLANEVIARVEAQHDAVNTLDTLKRTTVMHRNAVKQAEELMQKALEARENEDSDTTLSMPGTSPESANTIVVNETGNGPNLTDIKEEERRSLVMIASSASALLGSEATTGAEGFERYGLEQDIRSAAELEQMAASQRAEAESLKQQLEEAREAFFQAAKAAELDPEAYTGDPADWKIEFEAIDFAALGKDPRLGGEAAQKRESLNTDIMLDQEDLLMAKKSLEGSEELFANDFIPETEMERERLAYERKSRSLELKKETQRLFFAYDFPKLAEQAYADYEEALRLLERTLTTTQTKISAAEISLSSARTRLAYREEEIRENEELIKNYKIYAETEGLVVYGDPGGNSRYFENELIMEGATVREGQTLLTIPDITQMAVDVSIHEAAIKKVNNGLQARIYVEAFPEEDVTGEVTKVGVLPSSTSRYMNPDLKLYETTVSINGIYEWLKPGMTAKVEIYVDQLEDVLFVPLQAVATYNGDRVCYLASGERRIVETGQYSDNYIEIKSGLDEGDEVLIDLRAFKGEADKDNTGQSENDESVDSDQSNTEPEVEAS